MGVIEVLSLGSGTSTAALHNGVGAATSFVVLIDGIPSILIGLGSGTLRALYQYVGTVPSTVIILSGSLEQTAEVPLLIQTEVVEKKRRLHLFGASSAAVDVGNALIALYAAPSSLAPRFTQLVGRDSGQQTQLHSSSFTAISSCPTVAAGGQLEADMAAHPLSPNDAVGGGGVSGEQPPMAAIPFSLGGGSLSSAARAPTGGSGALGASASGGPPPSSLSSSSVGSILIHFRDRPVVSFTGPSDTVSPDTMLWLAQSPTVVCWTAPVGVETSVSGGNGRGSAMADRLPFANIVRWFGAHHASFVLHQQQQGQNGHYPVAAVSGDLFADAGIDVNTSTLALGAMASNESNGYFSQPSSPFGNAAGGASSAYSLGGAGGGMGFSASSFNPFNSSSSASATHLPAHCVLCGWGPAADEPLPLSLPPFVSLAPQGTLLSVLVGDFVKASAPNVAQSLRAMNSHTSATNINPTAGGAMMNGGSGGGATPYQQQYYQQQGSGGSVYGTLDAADALGRSTSVVSSPPTFATSSYYYGGGAASSSPVEPSLAPTQQYRGGGAVAAGNGSPPRQQQRSPPVMVRGAPLMQQQQQRPSSAAGNRPHLATSSGTTTTTLRSNSNGTASSRTAPRPTTTTTSAGRSMKAHPPAPASVAPSSSYSAAAAVPSRTSYVDTRRVRVFNNDNKGHEGKVFLMKNYRQVAKLNEAVAAQLGVMPLSGLVFVDGRKVTSLDDIPPDCVLVAVRRGGAPFDPRDLPRGVGGL